MSRWRLMPAAPRPVIMRLQHRLRRFGCETAATPHLGRDHRDRILSSERGVKNRRIKSPTRPFRQHTRLRDQFPHRVEHPIRTLTRPKTSPASTSTPTDETPIGQRQARHRSPPDNTTQPLHRPSRSDTASSAWSTITTPDHRGRNRMNPRTSHQGTGDGDAPPRAGRPLLRPARSTSWSLTAK